MNWLSQIDLGKLLAKGTKGVLVVVPDDIAEKARERIEAILKNLSDDFMALGQFAINLNGKIEEGMVPVFFIKESEFDIENNHPGLIRIIPLEGGEAVFADKKGLKGAESLNRELLEHLFVEVWKSMQDLGQEVL